MDVTVAGGCPGALGGRSDRLPRDGAADLSANERKPWLKAQWCIPPEANIRNPLPLTPGRPVRNDPEYERPGVVNCFLVSEPLPGTRLRVRRQVRLSERRTRSDWAHWIQKLNGVHFPRAECIVLVMDQLNSYSPAYPYQAFPSAEAKRLADRLEIHHTPKHGSWLTMAEIDLSILARQCLNRRRDDRATMGGVGHVTQRCRDHHRLAVHHGGCPEQTEAPLPGDSRVMEH